MLAQVDMIRRYLQVSRTHVYFQLQISDYFALEFQIFFSSRPESSSFSSLTRMNSLLACSPFALIFNSSCFHVSFSVSFVVIHPMP